MKKLLVAIGSIVVILVIAIVAVQSNSDGPAQGDTPGGIADDSSRALEESSAIDIPDLTLSDFDGQPVHLPTAFAGQPLVLNAWASWCPFCVNELPDFATVQAEFGDSVTIVAINRQESLATARGYTDRLKITDGLTYLLDPKDTFYRASGGFSMPETIFYDAAGREVEHVRGPIEINRVRELIRSIL